MALIDECDELRYGRKPFRMIRVVVAVLGVLLSTFGAFMLWFGIFDHSHTALHQALQTSIESALRLLCCGGSLLLVSLLMHISNKQVYPLLTLTQTGVRYERSKGKIFEAKWDSLGPFKLIYGRWGSRT